MSERSKKFLIAGITLILAAAILIAVGLVLRSNDGQEPEENTTVETGETTAAPEEETGDPESDTTVTEQEKPGLYYAGTQRIKRTWKQLIASGQITVKDTVITKVSENLRGDLIIPEEITKIAKGAFSGCSGLSAVSIGSGVLNIADQAFYNCTGIKSIQIPDSVTAIGSKAFMGCTGLKAVVIGSGVTTIGSNAFSKCTKLGYVLISDSVTAIGSNAFSECTGLKSVYIGCGATTIGSSAFSGCTALEEIFIPSTVSFVGDKAFYNCNAISRIKFENTQEKFAKITVGKSNTCLTDATFEYEVSAENEMAVMQDKIDALNPTP